MAKQDKSNKSQVAGAAAIGASLGLPYGASRVGKNDTDKIKRKGDKAYYDALKKNTTKGVAEASRPGTVTNPNTGKTHTFPKGTKRKISSQEMAKIIGKSKIDAQDVAKKVNNRGLAKTIAKKSLPAAAILGGSSAVTSHLLSKKAEKYSDYRMDKRRTEPTKGEATASGAVSGAAIGALSAKTPRQRALLQAEAMLEGARKVKPTKVKGHPGFERMPTSADKTRAAIAAGKRSYMKYHPATYAALGALIGGAALNKIHSANHEKKAEVAPEDRNWQKAGPYAKKDMVIGGAVPTALAGGLMGGGYSMLYNHTAKPKIPLRSGRVAAATSVLGALLGGAAGSHEFENVRGATNEEMAKYESAIHGSFIDKRPVDRRAVKITEQDLKDKLARDRAIRYMNQILEEYENDQ